MDKTQEQLDTLKDIRSMMERSSRFISLSGLSGVFAGTFALIGAYFAFNYIGEWQKKALGDFIFGRSSQGVFSDDVLDLLRFCILDGTLVLVASLTAAILLTIRNSRKRNIPIWDSTAKRLLINMMIPLAAGGIFCIVLIYHGDWGLVAPSTLLFYGLALFNASKYTLNDVRYLGICEMILGLIGAFFMGYGLIFWAVGFGALHIIYGAMMYFKYER